MVYIKGEKNPIEVLKAFLTTDLNADQLDAVHRAFELGSHAKFSPTMHLMIVDEPRYHSMSHQEIRRDQTSQGNTSAFLILDADTPKKGAVWYVDQFAEEDEVEDGEAESTDVLWKIHVKVEDVSILKVNYDIANSSLVEDLGNCGIEDYPIEVDYEQSELYDSGLDMEEEQYSQPVWLVAEPGEYEETSDSEETNRFLIGGGHPPKVARLTEDVARSAGIINTWSCPSETTEIDLPDGTKKTFPKGSVTLQMNYNPDHPWPPYQRLEGSL